jgi:hypothetical protein
MIIIKARGHAISDEDLLAKDPDRYRARLDRRKQRKSNEAEGFGERQFYNDPETAEARKLLAGLKKWEASYGSGGPISSPEELDKRLQQAHGTQQRYSKSTGTGQQFCRVHGSCTKKKMSSQMRTDG